MGAKPHVQSEEHILRESLLKKLGLYESTILPVIHLHKEAKFKELKPVKAGRLVQKGICADCNNGWMNRLDETVEETIVGFVKKEKFVRDLTNLQKEDLASWILKTACVKFMTPNLQDKAIPGTHYEDAFNRRWPDGAVAFVSYVRPDEATGAWISGGMRMFGIRPAQLFPLYTFVAHYRDVVFGIAFTDPQKASVVLTEDIHQPFCSSPSSFYISRDIQAFPIPNDPKPIGFSSVNTVARATGFVTSKLPEPADDTCVFYLNPKISLEENKLWYAHLLELKALGRYPGQLSKDNVADYMERMDKEVWVDINQNWIDRPFGLLPGSSHVFP